jgi:copper transport protein
VRTIPSGARVATIATALLVFTAVAAWAHARLVRSDPPKDARLAWPPTVIRLEFSEAVTAATSRVELVAPDSQRLPLVARGDSGGRKTLLATVPPLPSSGSYRVEWRLIGPDGHAVTGTYSFTVDSVVRQESERLPDPALHRGGALPPALVAAGSPLQQSTRFLWIAALLLVLGSTSLSLAVLPRMRAWNAESASAFRGGVDERLRSWTVAGAWGLLVLAAVRLTSQAVVLSGSVNSIRVGDVLGIVTGSTWGRGWLVFVAATVAVLVLARARRKAPGSPWPKIAAACVVLAISSPFLGHPASTAFAPLAMSLDAVHVVAAGGWGGSILMLALVALPRASAVAGDERANVLRGLLRAFSPVALSCAFALLVTGVFEAGLQLGSVSALWNSEYGQALFRKLVFVALVAGLGAWHWRFAQPALRSERSVTALRWSIALDVVFLLGVLVLTAILTGTAPPASAA